MTMTVRALLESHVDLLFQGRSADMLGHYDLPLAIQILTDMSVLSTADQFIRVMSEHRDDLIASGVIALTVRVAAIELPRRGRFRVWADFDHHRVGHVDRSADQIIIYCREEEGLIRIELLHCARFALAVKQKAHLSHMA